MSGRAALSLRRLLPPVPSLPASRAACLLVWRIQHAPGRCGSQFSQQQRRCCAPLAVAAAAATAEPAASSLQAAAPSSGTVQTFDYTALAAVTAELQGWVPAKVEAVVQQDTGTALRLRTVADSGWLHLSHHPRYAHVGLGEAPPRGSAAELFSFGSQLSSELRGLVLTGVQLPARYERVLRLAFAARVGEPPARFLLYECMARYSNLLLLGPDDTVLAAAHQVGQRMSTARQVRVGAGWEPPPPAAGLDPDSCPSLDEWRQVLCGVAAAATPGRAPRGVAQAAVRAFRGVSPSLARDLALAAGVPADAEPAALSAEQWEGLHAAWRDWLDRLAAARFEPTFCPASGAYSLLGTRPQRVPALLPFLHAHYTAPQRGEAQGVLRQQLERAVAAAAARLQRKAAALKQQGARGDQHAATQRQADLIMANLHRIPAGASSLEAEDWDSGEVVRLALDPTKSAVEAAEALYKQARKQRRAAEQVAPLLEAAARELEYLAEVEVMVQQAEGGDQLEVLREVQAELVAGGYVRAPPDAALAQKAATRAARAQRRGDKGGAKGGGKGGDRGGGSRDFRRYDSPSGFPVLVGRNSRQNDELSCRMAQPGEVWMHARGVPGAHLLMRVPAGQAPSDADLAFAANLAAWFSKARTEGRVDVTMCDPRHLSKPSGAKPGQVVVRKERVVAGRPGESVAALRGEE